MSKSEAIRRSLLCFQFGLVGLVPVIGIPWAVMAMTQYQRVKLGWDSGWNPAERYLLWGSRYVLLAILSNALAGLAICILNYKLDLAI
jgi:hypothetical protein